MRTKAITDLASLADEDLFGELSVGLTHILANAQRIYADATSLTDKSRGAAILSILAEEEAAKFFILIDSARCPRDEPKRLSKYLARYYDHLATGIYAAACYWAPETFGDLVAYIDSERQRYHLDGLNDIDWIFWNQILTDREQAIYVDYVETDQDHVWLCPPREDVWAPYPSMALSLAEVMQTAGFTSADGLQVLAEAWRPLRMESDYQFMDLRKRNWETLKKLDAAGLAGSLADQDQRVILDHWPFPLHSVDLSLSGIDNRPELRRIQKKYREL